MNLFNAVSGMIRTPTQTFNPDDKKQIIDFFQTQQELKCDPLYVTIKLGSVHMLYLKLKSQQNEEALKAEREGKAPPSLNGIKISFKEDCSLKVEEPGLSQSFTRYLEGASRDELGWIRPHLIKFLRWFDYQHPNYKILIEACKQGIIAILEGYKNAQSHIFTITEQPNLESSLSKENLINSEREGGSLSEQVIEAVNIQVSIGTPETDAIIRMLEHDIDLLDEALKDKNVDQKKEFDEKLDREDRNFFSLHRLTLKNLSQTIDSYMAHQVISKWKEETIQGAVGFFKAPAQANLYADHYHSIAGLTQSVPNSYFRVKEEIREHVNAALLICHIEHKRIR